MKKWLFLIIVTVIICIACAGGKFFRAIQPAMLTDLEDDITKAYGNNAQWKSGRHGISSPSTVFITVKGSVKTIESGNLKIANHFDGMVEKLKEDDWFLNGDIAPFRFPEFGTIIVWAPQFKKENSLFTIFVFLDFRSKEEVCYYIALAGNSRMRFNLPSIN